MLQRQCRDFEVVVGVDQGRHLTLYRVDVDSKFGVMDEKLNLRSEDLFVIRRDIEVYVVETFVKRHGREHPDQSQTVVAVRMADEDVPHLAVMEFVLDELPLRAFAAVNHVQRPLTVHNLR